MARLSLAYGVLVTAAMGALAWQPPDVVDTLRDRVFDSYQRLMPVEQQTSAPVAVVDIDAEALAEFGPWPWPRSYMAELTDRLFDHGAVAVGFDLSFPLPDPTSPERILDSWTRFGPGVPPSLPDFGLRPHDTLFADALRGRPVVFRLREGAQRPVGPRRAEITLLGDMPEALADVSGVADTLPILSRAVSGLGLDGLTPDTDGTVRRARLVTAIGDDLAPSFAAELLRVAQSADGYELRIESQTGLGLLDAAPTGAFWIGVRPVPIGPDGALRLRPGPERVDRVVPAAEVLRGAGLDTDVTRRLSGRVVLVGTTAPEIGQVVRTPLAASRAEVLVQADLLEQILSDRFLDRPVWVKEGELIGVLILGLILSVLLWRGRVGGALAVALVAIGVSVLAGVTAFARHGLLVDPSLPVMTVILVCLPGLLIQTGMQRATRYWVRGQFDHPLHPQVLAAAAAHPKAALTPRGEAREVTVAAIELRGLEAVVATHPPSEALALIARARGAVAEQVAAYGGMFESKGETAGMAIWNAPIVRPDHPAAALSALPALETALARVAPLDGVSVSIGVASGRAVLGSVGARRARRYTVIGPVKDLADHLQVLAPSYGVISCVGAEVAAQVPVELIAVELDRAALRHDTEAEPIFTVFDREQPGADRFATLLGEARAAFLDRDWPGAEAAFTSLAALDMDLCDSVRLAQVYLDRIEGFHRVPPPIEWDGSALG